MSRAELTWISGPVLRARPQGPFRIQEAVRVGEAGLLGEVIRLARGEIVVQVYEETAGLRPGVTVEGTGQPLAVELGPSLLGRIFDGLLRPLTVEEGRHVRPGLRSGEPESFPFRPEVAVGDRMEPGSPFGRVQPAGSREQRCLIPPETGGEVTWVAEAGEYREDASLLRLRDDAGVEHEAAMRHSWPVRHPRPVAQRRSAEAPMVTGQRIVDILFPVAQGGRAALPGGFGTGKTMLQESLAKFADADIIVYVGCGERGNEMAGVLDEFPQLDDPLHGRPLMERTVIIANTSNMPVAAREASIYTGVTVAEYFRDQGLNVALMADSTSRWAEALREVSGRLGELPGEGGYPAYLSSRLADFYERAGTVVTRGGDAGSLTLIGAVSPPSGDFSEPVTTHTKRYTRCFWALDRERAQARFYPAIHPLTSYSEDATDLAGWWERQGHAEWLTQRRQFLSLLEEQQRLERMARIVGKDALPPAQRITLLSAELVNEGFLRQSALSPTDRHCSPARQIAMQRAFVRFIDRARAAVEAGVPVDAIAALDLTRRLRRLGEEYGEERLGDLEALPGTIDAAMADLERDHAEEGGYAG
jgi:V/A-type H+-transporting ATPase subunit A